MTECQLNVLRGYLDAQENGICHVEQINWLAGGQISDGTLTVVTVQSFEDGKHFRYADEIDGDGRTIFIVNAELAYNPFTQEVPA